MKIALEKVKSSGSFTMTDEGTLAANLEEGDIIDFSAANIRREDKRVDLIIYEKGNRDEAPSHLPLTEPMSQSVRKALSEKMKKTKVLTALLDCHIRIDDKGRRFLTAKDGASEGLVFTKETVAASVAAYEEVVAF